MKKELMVLALAATLAAPAFGQSAGRGLEAKDTNPAAAGGFSTMDRNNDGYLSREEVRDAPWNNRFSELDKDNDGRISQREFDALQGATGPSGRDASSPSTTGGMGGSVGPGGTQSGSSTSGVGDKPGQKQ
jgi:hypothetical protein